MAGGIAARGALALVAAAAALGGAACAQRGPAVHEGIHKDGAVGALRRTVVERAPEDAAGKAQECAERECAAEPGAVEATQQREPYDGDLHLRTLLRRDELSWNIGETGGVNVLSELSWENVDSRGLELAGDLPLPRSWILLGHSSYGWIRDGDNQDLDFDGPDRTELSSRSDNDAGKGRVIELSAALGYELAPRGRWQWRITPLLGLAYHQQSLHMRDMVQTVPDLGALPGLDSHYRASWYGPWLGVRVAFQPAQRWRVNAGLQLHGVQYRAVANWNLRQDFDHSRSFEHEARGYGASLQTQLAWQMTRRWTIDMSARALGFRTRPGKDTLYFADGSRARSELNEVAWRSLQLVLGATYGF